MMILFVFLNGFLSMPNKIIIKSEQHKMFSERYHNDLFAGNNFDPKVRGIITHELEGN